MQPAPNNSFSDRCPMAAAKADLIHAIASIALPEVGTSSADLCALAKALKNIEVAIDDFGLRVGEQVHGALSSRVISAADYLLLGTDTFDSITYALTKTADEMDAEEYLSRRSVDRIFRRGVAA